MKNHTTSGEPVPIQSQKLSKPEEGSPKSCRNQKEGREEVHKLPKSEGREEVHKLPKAEGRKDDLAAQTIPVTKDPRSDERL